MKIFNEFGLPLHWGFFLGVVALAILVLPALIAHWSTVVILGVAAVCAWLGQRAAAEGDASVARYCTLAMLGMVVLAVLAPLYRAFGALSPVLVVVLVVGWGVLWFKKHARGRAGREASSGE